MKKQWCKDQNTKIDKFENILNSISFKYQIKYLEKIINVEKFEALNEVGI